MTQTQARSILMAVAVTSAATTTGCGGGNSPMPTPPATPRPTSTPPLPTPQTATAQGHVVDEAANAPLAGVPIAIASPGSNVFTTEPATAADGSFSFTAAAGTYIIAVGSNSASSAVTATAHDRITLVAGRNAIGEQVPHAVADVTPTPAQLSGNFRLATLSATESDCLSGMNTGRLTAGLSALVADEEDLELVRAFLAEEIAQQTQSVVPLAQNYTLFLYPTGTVAGTTVAGTATSCDQWTDTYTFSSGNPPYQYATNPTIRWYGASFGPAGNTWGAQFWSK